jgi:aspartate/methionine/tyrosine aminotransferase
VESDQIPIAGRIGRLKPTAVNSILAEVRAVQAEGRRVISLMRGEPDFATPPHIVDAAIEALHRGRTGYPDNRGEIGLRSAVAAKLQRETEAVFDPVSEILITDGATLGISSALLATIDEGDEVLLPDPIYDAYQSPVRLAGGVVKMVPSRIANGRFCLDAEALDAACTPRTRVLILNTPWNPVGTVFTAEEIRGIASFVARRGILLISDEIYERITYAPHRHLSPLQVAPEIRSHCLIVNSFSKTYAMTGWRLGYCAGPKNLIQAMFLALQQSSRGPSTFIQDAGVAALNGPETAIEDMRSEYARRRALVAERLKGIDGVFVLDPEGGFFSMVDIRARGVDSNTARKRLLNEFGVVVAHGAAYGEGGEGTLRVSFASGGENLVSGLERLREGLAAL